MNLFRNQNKLFKSKLKKKLNDTEYKPSESLWEKIANELPEDDFEKTISGKVDHFEPTVNPDTWEHIETKLAGDESNYLRKFLWVPLLLIFFGSAAYFGYKNLSHQTEKTILNQSASNITETTKKISVIPENILSESITKYHNSDSKKSTISKISQDFVSHKNKQHIEQIAEQISETSISKKQTLLVKHKQHKNALPIAQKSKRNVNPQFVGRSINQSSNSIITNDLAVNHDLKNEQNLLAQTNIKPDSNITTATKKLISADKEIKNSSTFSEIKNQFDTIVLTKKTVAKKSNQNDLTHFSINAMLGMQYCYNHLSAPTNSIRNYAENILLRSKIESPSIDWSGGFLLGYHVNEHWKISAGVNITNFSQSFQFSTVSPNSIHIGISEPGVSMTNVNDSIINGNSNTNHIKYTWTEIPITLTYSFSHKNKFGIELTAGLSYAIITKVDAAYVSYDNVGVLIVNDENRFPGIRNNFFAQFNPSVTYKVNDLVTIGASPTFKYSFTSITANENWVNQNPYFFGFCASIQRRF